MADERPITPDTSRKWTRIEDYGVVFGRRRSSPPPLAPRTEPEEPRFLLSTLPFMLLIFGLLGIGVAIMILAIPSAQTGPAARAPLREQGVAQRGWMDDARQEFRRQKGNAQ